MVILGVLTSCNAGQNEEALEPVGIIFDTDMTTDCDDAGALAMLHTLDQTGEANILATVVNNKGDHSAGATKAINTFYGRADIPVGVYKGDDVGRDAADFFSAISRDIAAYGHSATSRDQLPDAVDVYRKTLAEAGPGEVVIASVGHLNNLYDLLQSGPDSYSPLNGRDLVEQKVHHLVVMGGHFLPDAAGQYPNGCEHNFRARGSARFTGPALDLWPGEILFSGYEIGEKIMTGSGLTRLGEGHPVRRAYEGHPSEPLVNGRMSWDQTAVLAAVRGPQAYWDVSEPGRIRVDSEGCNTWTDDRNGQHAYLISRENPSPSDIGEIIEKLMVNSP